MARRKKAKVTESNYLSVSPWQLDALEVETLRRRLAKQANQRLVRLERRKASTGEALSEFGAAQYAYGQITQIRAAEGQEKKQGKKLRFKESHRNLTDSQSRMELYALQNFLSQESSKAGTAAKYVSKTELTFKERGVSVGSYKSFYNFLNSSAFALLKEELNSNDIVELYNKAHEAGNSFKKIDKIINDYLASIDETDEPASKKDLAKALGVSIV